MPDTLKIYILFSGQHAHGVKNGR